LRRRPDPPPLLLRHRKPIVSIIPWWTLSPTPRVRQGGQPGRLRFIVMHTHRSNAPEVTREPVEEWYRDRAHLKFPERIELCLGLFPEPKAFRPKGLIVRQTRQRWGSMSPAGRLLLNRRLVQAPIDAIDYVITHELCHISEPHHGAAFYDLLDRVLPDWQRRKLRLERVMA
ncbi:MAG: M48 family metallopeptidase, partial [Thermoanaerobaculia bacterium]|nr:M48 family metallopeptidase [Thermoanaerobaculia bacterium]